MVPPAGPQDEGRRLAALRALNILDTPPEERFDRITRLAQRTFRMPTVLISLIDEKRLWFKSRVGLAPAELPREGSFCGEAARGDGLMIVPDADKDPRFAGSDLVTGGPRIRFYAGQPLAGPDGSVLGTLCLIDATPRELDLEQRRALRDLAGMVEEQIAASSAEAAAPADEHSRLLARLRLSPEHASARRNARGLFVALAVAIVLVTGISLHLANRLAAAANGGDLAALRSTAHFFQVAVGVRGLIATVLLLVVLLIVDRHLDARLSTLAAVELDRARLHAVIDAIGDGVVVADARGRFTVFNPAAERILGHGLVDHPAETSRFYASFFATDGSPCPPDKHPLTRAIAGESAHGERLVVRNERRPGGVSVAITATPVRAFDGSPAGGVIIFRDAA
jgi:PAS domain-containing protein